MCRMMKCSGVINQYIAISISFKYQLVRVLDVTFYSIDHVEKCKRI